MIGLKSKEGHHVYRPVRLRFADHQRCTHKSTIFGVSVVAISGCRSLGRNANYDQQKRTHLIDHAPQSDGQKWRIINSIVTSSCRHQVRIHLWSFQSHPLFFDWIFCQPNSSSCAHGSSIETSQTKRPRKIFSVTPIFGVDYTLDDKPQDPNQSFVPREEDRLLEVGGSVQPKAVG